MEEIEEEVRRLQLLVMEHEHLLEQYSDLFRDQQQQIDLLKGQLKLLDQKLTKYEDSGEVSLHAERPPHY
ncbi:MAG: SlyX family protein [Arenicellales bacterium]